MMFSSKLIFAFLLVCTTHTMIASFEENWISESRQEPYTSTHIDGWEENLEMAQKRAQETGKPLLIAFLGPNWSSWSDQLVRTTLSTSSFLESAGEECILVKVDISEQELIGASYSDNTQEAAQKEILQQRYHIDTCPSMVLVTPQGEMIAQVDYIPGHKRELAAEIKRILDDFSVLSQLQHKEIVQLSVEDLRKYYKKATQFADAHLKTAFFEEGLKKDESPFFLLEQYEQQLTTHKYYDRQLKRIRNKIIARDPTNAFGARRKIALIDFAALSSDERRVSSKRAIRPLVQYSKKFGKQDPDYGWRVEMKISQYLFGKDDLKNALMHAERSLDLAPLSALNEVKSAIAFLREQLHQKKEHV